MSVTVQDALQALALPELSDAQAALSLPEQESMPTPQQAIEALSLPENPMEEQNRNFSEYAWRTGRFPGSVNPAGLDRPVVKPDDLPIGEPTMDFWANQPQDFSATPEQVSAWEQLIETALPTDPTMATVEKQSRERAFRTYLLEWKKRQSKIGGLKSGMEYAAKQAERGTKSEQRYDTAIGVGKGWQDDMYLGWMNPEIQPETEAGQQGYEYGKMAGKATKGVIAGAAAAPLAAAVMGGGAAGGMLGASSSLAARTIPFLQAGLNYVAMDAPAKFMQAKAEGADDLDALLATAEGSGNDMLWDIAFGVASQILIGAGIGGRRMVQAARQRLTARGTPDATGTGTTVAPAGAGEGLPGGEGGRLRVRNDAETGVDTLPRTQQEAPPVTQKVEPVAPKPSPVEQAVQPVSEELPNNLFKLKKLAKERGVDISDLKGPGAMGRIKERLAAQKPPEPTLTTPTPAARGQAPASKAGEPEIKTIPPRTSKTESGEAGDVRQSVRLTLQANAEDARTAGRPIVKESQILDQLSKDLGVPIRSGHFGGKKSEGFFRIKEEVIRNRRANDLVTSSHEAGHAIEKILFGDVRGVKNFPRQTHEELSRLGKALYGKAKTARGYISEGFSEYIRYHTLGKEITGVNIEQIAPQTTKFFNEHVLKNPRIKTALDNFTQYGREFYKQGSLNRVKSLIATEKSGTLGERLLRMKDRAEEALLDDAAFLEKIERSLHGGELAEGGGTKSPTAMYRAMINTSEAKTQARLFVGQFDRAGNKIGPSLREVFKDINPKEYDDVVALAMAKRTVEKAKQGIAAGPQLKDAEQVIRMFEGNPRFQAATKGITEWNDGILQYLKEAGGLSDEAVEAIRESNLMYIPFIRHFEGLERAGGITASSGRFANITSPIKRMKGSQRDIIHPVVAMAQQANKIIASADQIAVGRAFIDMVESRQGMGFVGEKLAKKISSTRFSLNEIKQQLEKAGAVLDDADGEAILSIFRPKTFASTKENIVTLYRNGQKEVWQLHPEIYKVAMGTSRDLLPSWLTMVAGAPARLVRTGATGVEAGFAATNAVKDLFSAVLQTPQTGIRRLPGNVGYVFKGHGKALGRLGKQIVGQNVDDPVVQAYLAMGGDFTSLAKLDSRRNIRKHVDEILSSSAKRRAYNVVRHPIEALREVIGTTELGPRFGEFEKALRKAGWSEGKPFTEDMVVKAFNAASEVTLNFRKAGTVGREINKLSAFFNAGIQGLAKTASVLKNNPKEVIATALATITAPTIYNWWTYKDEKWYQELQDWEKYGFWNFKVGERIIKIPRPHEWGYLFGALPEVLLDSLYRKDPGQFKNFGKQFARQNIPNPTPDILNLMVEWYSNKNMFTGQRIVSQYDEENLEPYMQYQPWTTETMKAIGQVFNISPAKLDNAFNSITGGFYRRVADPVEHIFSAFGILPEQPQDPDVLRKVPVVGRFVKRDSPSTKSVEEFYDILQDLRQKRGGAKRRNETFKDEMRYKHLERIHQEISNHRKAAIESKNEKDVREHWDAIVNLARSALGKDDTK